VPLDETMSFYTKDRSEASGSPPSDHLTLASPFYRSHAMGVHTPPFNEIRLVFVY